MDTKKRLNELNATIEAKKMDLLDNQDEVLAFVDTNHKAIDTKEYQKALRVMEIQVNEIIRAASVGVDGEFSALAEKLCNRAEKLKEIVRDMNGQLAQDFEERHKAEDIDPVKVASMILGFAVASLTFSKHIFDPNSSHATLEASAGAIVGSAIPLRKNVRNAFKEICLTPRKIGESFLVHYIKETGIAFSKQVKNTLNNENSLLVFRI